MPIYVGQPLPAALLDAQVLDGEGKSRRLGDLAAGPALLVFLRHFGCVHCSRQVDALGRRLPELEDLGVRVVLVGSGPPVDMEAFRARQALHGRPLTLVTDPTLAAYRAAEMDRSIVAVWEPLSLWEEVQAMGKGYFPRRPSGDVAQLGGALMTDENNTVVFTHRSKRPGDLADVADIVDAALRLVVARVAASGRV